MKFIFISIVLLSSTVQAAAVRCGPLHASSQLAGGSRIKFGFEPQAYDLKLMKDSGSDRDYVLQLQAKVADHIVATVPGSRIESRSLNFGDYHEQGITVLTPQGKIHVGADGEFIEVQPPPLSTDQILQVTKPIYQAFREAHLKTEYSHPDGIAKWGSGWHIHVEKNIFEENPILLRNLLVDFHNRPYLDAIFKKIDDYVNAMTYYEVGMQSELAKVIKDIDQKAALTGGYRFEDILERLRTSPLGSNRYFAINLNNLVMTKRIPTIEFRFMSGHASEMDLYHQAQFLENYLLHLSRQKQPLALRSFQSFQEFASERAPSKAIASFEQLASRIGLKETQYERFVRHRFPLNVDQEVVFQGNHKVRIQVRVFDNRPSFTNATLMGLQDGVGTWFEISVHDPSGQIKSLNLLDQRLPRLPVKASDHPRVFREIFSLFEPRKGYPIFSGKVEGLDSQGNVVFETPLEFNFRKFDIN